MIKTALLRFDKLLHETQRAYLIRVGSDQHWLPKKLCRKMIINKKLGGNVELPAFLYQRITGILPEDIGETEAVLTITHHIPEPIQPVTATIHASLIK